MSLSRVDLTFVLKVTVAHALTYVVAGMAAAAVLDYERLLSMPVIGDYMKPFASVGVVVALLSQVARGAIFGVVLLPFRHVLGSRRGWLWLWGLLTGVGILSTFAAAPGSIEGVVYTRLPLWYHLLGLPEILLQALALSAFVALFARHPVRTFEHLPPAATRVVRAVVVTCMTFAGYAVASVVFAVLAGARLDDEANFSPATQAVFAFPLAVNAVIAFATARGVSRGARAYAAVFAYLLGAAGILLYQSAVFGASGGAYAIVAPLLPALVLWLMIPRSDEAAADGRATSPVSRDAADERAA